MKVLRSLLLALALCIALLPRHSAAQSQFDELGLTLRPAIIELVGDPGTTVTTRITIESNSSDAVGVTIGSRSLLPNDPEIDQEKRKLFDASSWIVPVQKDVLLTPGQQATSEIQVVIPPDASPGGHYALITYSPLSATATDIDDQNRVGAQPEITSIALITVPGDINESAYAEARDAGPIRFNAPFSAGAEFFNDGNVHVLPSVRATVHKNNGDVVRTIPLQPQLSLPNTRKPIDVSWDPEGMFGRFYIEYEFTFGTPSQKITTQSATFLVLPSTGTLLFGLSLLIVLAVVIRKSWPLFRRWVLKKGIYKNKRHSEPRDAKAPKPVAPRSLDAIVQSRELKETPRKRPLAKPKPKSKPQKTPSPAKKKTRRKIKVRF